MTPTLRDDLAADLRKIDRDTSRTAEDIAADLIALGWTKTPQAGEPAMRERIARALESHAATVAAHADDALDEMAHGTYIHAAHVARTTPLTRRDLAAHPVTITTSPAQDEWTVGDDR